MSWIVLFVSIRVAFLFETEIKMSVEVLQPSSVKRMAVFRALKLGDLLCVIPAVRALKAGYPSARITLIGLSWSVEFVARFSHLFDDFMEFPGYPGLPERVPNVELFPSFLRRAQEKQFDLALQMHGSGTHVNEIVALLGAKSSAGFYTEHSWHPAEGCWIEYPQNEPEIWRHLRLTSALGLPYRGTDLEFPLYPQDQLRLRALLETLKLSPQPYACVHPGGISAQTWPAEHFAAAADYLLSRGLSIILTGSAGERALCDEVRSLMRGPAVNLAGKTDLGLIGALIDQCSLLLSHDTGVSHIAAARQTPSVIVYSAGTAEKKGEAWPPLNNQLHRFVMSFQTLTPDIVCSTIDDLMTYVENKKRRRFASVNSGLIAPQTAVQGASEHA